MPSDEICGICDLAPFAAFAHLSAPPDLGSHAEDQQEARIDRVDASIPSYTAHNSSKGNH
jgi:hypothetical protein